MFIKHIVVCPLAEDAANGRHVEASRGDVLGWSGLGGRCLA